MPVQRLRNLSGRERSSSSNRHLALFLAFIAGAIDVGGYVSLKHYSSHMSGIMSTMARNSALGDATLAVAGFCAMFAFLVGAACTAILVNWGRHNLLQSEYALPMMLEAFLLTLLGLAGQQLAMRQWLFVPVAVLLLCFSMGLQNAIITKISQAEIRTTHVTGIVTDIGIEFGKLLYWNRSSSPRRSVVCADREKLSLLISLLVLFFGGGVSGALGFRHFGFGFTLPLVLILMVLATVPILDDLRARIWNRDLLSKG